MRIEPEDYQPFIDRLKAMDPEELRRGLNSDLNNAELEHIEFEDKFKNGVCYLCGEKLNRCNRYRPCIHCLLRLHKRIKKKDIEAAILTKNLFEVIAYLRWIASQEKKLSNINDFEAYTRDNNLIYQETIKYKELSWTITIKKGDLKGHGGKFIDFPHYHFHMTINGMSFIDFGDYHFPLSEYDIFNIYCRKGQYEKIMYSIPHGESYSDLFNNIPVDNIIDNMSKSDDESKAEFDIQTYIQAKDGKMIKGEDLAKIFAEQKNNNKTFASLAKKLDADVVSTVTPKNLVEPIIRKQTKSGR